jgi:ribonuclease HI
MAKVQRLAALVITGMLRTTPNDVLDAHAELIPIDLMLEKICYRNIVQTCTLPPSKLLSWITRGYHRDKAKWHITNLQTLIQRFDLDLKTVETIGTPQFTSADPLPLTTNIADTRDNSIQGEATDSSRFKVYSDGSGQNGQAGAAAILYVDNKHARTLQLHLGSLKEHMMYEAEIVGGVLAAQLMKEIANTNPGTEVTHYMDSQSIIKTLTSKYLIDSYQRQVTSIHEMKGLKIVLRWISAHLEVAGNEAVDEAVKEVAGGRNSERKELPAILWKGQLAKTKSALKQEQGEKIKRRWKEAWRHSLRYEWMR